MRGMLLVAGVAGISVVSVAWLAVELFAVGPLRAAIAGLDWVLRRAAAKERESLPRARVR